MKLTRSVFFVMALAGCQPASPIDSEIRTHIEEGIEICAAAYKEQKLADYFFDKADRVIVFYKDGRAEMTFARGWSDSTGSLGDDFSGAGNCAFLTDGSDKIVYLGTPLMGDLPLVGSPDFQGHDYGPERIGELIVLFYMKENGVFRFKSAQPFFDTPLADIDQ